MMSREQRQFIQFVAALTMLIDHIGVIFFPAAAGFRAIGRLSFPLFAFGIAQGVSHTSDFRKYMGRLLLAALISQPIYKLAFGMSDLNPLFMLAWGALVLWCWRKEWKAAAAVLLLGAGFVDMSYSWYGVWAIFLFGFYWIREDFCFCGQLVLNVLYGLTTGVWLQAFALFSFSFLDGKWHIPALSRKMPRYFFYVFYPLHLLVLWGIAQII